MKKFKVIDCGKYIYIAEEDRWAIELENYLFDGKYPERTNRSGWYKLDKIPTKVQQKRLDQLVNKRYELKAGYVPTDLMPSVITMEMYNSGEYDEVIGLYTLKYDKKDGGYEQVEFEISVVYKRENFEFVPNKYNASVDLLTQIEYPEVVHQDMPCRLSSKQMFQIIRAHVKKNLDYEHNKITSDYDFHFEVVKNIGLANPYTEMVNLNSGYKRRAPKWTQKVISEKKVAVLNIKDGVSSTDYGKDCRIAPTITGENYKDLEQKVEKYLDELMKSINKNYCECPNCKGWGVVEV